MAMDVTEIGKKYGDIFTVYMLMTPMVILNSYQVMKELLESKEYSHIFSGRVSDYFSKELLPDDLIFQPATETQQYMRKVVMRGIKQYGTALKRVQHIAQDELRKLIQRVQQKDGVAFDPSYDMNLYVINIMLILVRLTLEVIVFTAKKFKRLEYRCKVNVLSHISPPTSRHLKAK